MGQGTPSRIAQPWEVIYRRPWQAANLLSPFFLSMCPTMTDVSRGSLDGSDLKIAVIQSRFNESVTEALLQGALEGLEELGVVEERVHACSVPGAVELPLVARDLAASGTWDAIIVVGAVIRGETSHYDYVCNIATDGCLRASLDTGVPIAFGVLTCDTSEQAFARCAPGKANKGRESARVAVELANLLRGRKA